MKPRTFPIALLACLAMTLGAAATQANAADMRATLSSREAYVGAPVTLQLEVADAASHDEPQIADVPGLDIQMAGTPSRSTQTTIINGRRSDRTSVVYAWQITPRKAGTFEIPPIELKIDGQTRSTRPIRFVATKSETGDLMFAEITGQQKEIYVGQPLTLTLNLWIKPYHDADFDLTLSEENMWQLISAGTNWGAFSERMHELAENRQRPGGTEVLREDSTGAERSYYHYQIDATVYPKRPGQIEADDLQIVLDYPTRLAKSRDPFGSMFDDDFFGGRSPFGNFGMSPFNRNTLSVAASRPVVADAKVDSINVKPIPTAGRPADYRGTVGQYELVTQATPTSVKAGDPITLHIGIRGDGPMELVQAPPLAALPQLTANFKVANEPLAGIVEDDVKLFTTTIRPRREGITEIPAIPLSYFNPTTEKFVTVESAPISIHVDPAERLALDAIIGNANGNPSQQDEGASASTFDLSNYRGVDALVSARDTSPWTWLVVAILPPLAFAAFWGLKRRQSGNDASTETIRAARHAIEHADSAAGIAAALHHLNAGSHSEQFDALLARCDHAAYSGAQLEQLPELKRQALGLLDKWSAISAQSPQMPTTTILGGRRKLAIACLALAAAAVALPASLHFLKSETHVAGGSLDALKVEHAPMLTPQQRETILSEANRAYQNAMKTSSEDAAAAKENLAKAATKYGQLVDDGVHSPELYVNLANAQLQLGSTGKAIANYDRALAIDGSNHQARQNLAAAKAAIAPSPSAEDASTSLSAMLSGAVERVQAILNPTTATTLCVTAWIALWLIVLGAMVRPNLIWTAAAVPTIFLLLVGFAASNIHGLAVESPHAIVAAPAATLRQAPGDQFPQVSSAPLSEGETLEVLKADGDWLQIRTPSGTTGWIAHPEVEVL
ncbi:BatD family protein [Blastopirellula sp. JC732]|uniref:BatD family protein n=1 Tax=Blastopirellula sediminis TaxID=2894196 RepID=A0A9X1SI85_9BACT|nr:BatD family protein [Blastopirellula sediminis]MCC9606150.1 BatD family protein [Blastopirellula sediminis]MCC9630551.1 BatD family protein [Blastopirellula sediminis]